MDGKIHERLRAVRSDLGLTQREFCAQIGMAQSTYAYMETGGREIKDAYIKLICKSFGVDEEWVRTGDGQMYLLEATDRDFSELLKVYDRLSPALQKYLLGQARELMELQKQEIL